MKRLSKFLTIALLTCAVFTQLIGTQAFATSDAANVLQVSPVRSDVVIDPGASKVVKIQVSNPTKSDVKITPVENDFVSRDDSGTPALIEGPNQYASTHSLKRFMTPLQPFILKAGASKTLNVNITVPQSAQAGGYFGAVRLEPTSPDDGGQVNMSVNVAPLILLTVPGKVAEKLNLTAFKIEQDGMSKAYYQTPDNMSVMFRFENKGNVQEGPLGHIAVKKGKKVVYETDFNNKDQRDMILPDGARKWDVPLKNIGSFGHYTVEATFSYGASNNTIQVSKSFWVVPMKVVLLAVGGLIVLVALIVGFWLFLRGYRNRLLSGRGRRR